MMIAVRMTTDDVTQLMIPVRETWSQQNEVGALSEEVDFRGEKMSSKKNDLCMDEEECRHIVERVER